ncbi:hypothetical protein C5L38_34345 (plasmid) [Streptomyces sp. WAC00288]|nr:hypothetical protein C5L38_34345 [Streptomyces sp. WAC00288]
MGGAEDSVQDIAFRSAVHCERLRFLEEPRTAVSFPGAGERKSVSRSRRTRLPDKVAPGLDYYDITVAYHLQTRLTDEPGDGRDNRTARPADCP